MKPLSEIIRPDPNKPGNVQYTTATGVRYTTGPAQDPNHRGGRFVSVQRPNESGHTTAVTDSQGRRQK